MHLISRTHKRLNPIRSFVAANVAPEPRGSPRRAPGACYAAVTVGLLARSQYSALPPASGTRT
jgi:hypothetical protein